MAVRLVGKYPGPRPSPPADWISRTTLAAGDHLSISGELQDVRTWGEEVPLPPGPDLSWLADWQILLNAPVLFRGNSTFAWWAGELADHEAVFCPVVDKPGKHVFPFVAGNHEKTWPTGPDLRLEP